MHLSGYFSLRDINNENNAGNNNWPVLQGQERISRQYWDLYRSSSMLESDFGKDQLRQTMLKHQTVFQHQLHELHRLYNTQRHMMNEFVKNEKQPCEFSAGDLTFCLPFESRRSEWWSPVSNSLQSVPRFKDGELFDKHKYKETWRRLFDLEVPADQYLDGDYVFPEVSIDARQSFPAYHKNNGDASGSCLNPTLESCLFDLNESLPDDEAISQRFNLRTETAGSLGGSFQCTPKKGTVSPGIFGDNHREIPYKSPQDDNRKLCRNRMESYGKNKIFGVEISGTNPSSNSCLKILGFSVPENRHEPQDLTSSSCSPSKSGSPASVLPCVGNSSKVESLNTDHVQKPAANQSVTGFSIDLNICAEEGKDEEGGDRLVSSPRKGSGKLGIDLEALASFDPETPGSECESLGKKPENETLHREEEALTVLAAEDLLHISLSCINDLPAKPDLLSWFADVITSHEVPPVSTGKNSAFPGDTAPEEIDYFECMTLRQPEMTVELCKNILRDNENSRAQSSRHRGHARRGRRRQRKDFQRDVLPTLTSLSRKEAIDDLQAIGELLRDTGEKGESGSIRIDKNGSRSTGMGKTGFSRGRKRLVCGETESEEKTLVFWGKRTRRPSRQRCGNAPTVIASK